ncbi:adenylate/guanylate cyclase domain-containing protein [Acuticoccus mangrovi]|uniref:Adenylate/guanylate cyclase domain-containing protein n=1 Tax=Acuticoccus mangrovi TaxID=2796142 RepID=A0A934ITP9_9HYPH|nr:adenylate/guanylate cyclase domain-containing protein [Acuticoccus mangrovi]MBJ3777519.1 adenylate/guanylate cyclase domain-containing protein [Acuticoccus mangrovi]
MIAKSLTRHLGLPEGAADRMPARVFQLVLAEEERSERLIGWVQLLIVIATGTLYLIAPRPTDANSMFQPVPAVLTTYAVFTIVRIVASYRGFLPGWFLVLSMIADVAQLYTLIFTIHIAYAQPPAFYLKVPTFAYIFVLIAIRALRFDARFVITQGLLAAAGWILLTLYPIQAEGPGVITRSFVAYMTDSLVLLGAEFDKVFTILLVTAVLALSLTRARRTLITAVRESAATRDMRRYFGTGVADAITSRETAAMAGDAQDRDAAILMLDLRGFTAFAADRPPRAVVDTLTRYHRLVVPIIERHGGVVDKFLGDGVMATFGALTPSATAAADCLAALQEIVDARAEWDAGLVAAGLPAVPINGAAVAGRVVAATLGSEARLEFTVIGQAANLAAKLEKFNKETGTIALTTDETLSRARAAGFAGDLSDLGPMRVAGADGQLHLWAMTDERSG